MTDVTQAPQDSTDVGVTVSRFGSLSTSDTYFVKNNGSLFLNFQKSSAGACIVTIKTPATVGGLAVAERTVTVPASTGDMIIGPFPPGIYNDSSGNIQYTLDEITGLDVGIFQVS